MNLWLKIILTCIVGYGVTKTLQEAGVGKWEIWNRLGGVLIWIAMIATLILIWTS